MPNDKHDIHGKKRMPINVLSTWISQSVLIVSGFIIPRLINDSIGQTSLGIWDFAWALVSHFSLVQAGVASSVNRYVAKYRANGETESINRSVSSVAIILMASGTVVLALTFSSAFLMPYIISETLHDYIIVTRWVLILLGVGLGTEIAFTFYGGVLYQVRSQIKHLKFQGQQGFHLVLQV